MQNIDPVYFLFPVVVIAICVGLIIYWRKKRKSFAGAVLVYSLIAYAGAIALKYIVQIPTIQAFTSLTGGSLAALGVYYGLQTVIFEVGGAYVVARYAVSRNKLKAKEAEGYGLGLAFWENAIYIGALTLINYIIYYAILGSGSSGAAQILYSALPAGLFASPSVALVSVGYSILGRVSSILIHFSWGFLVVLAAVYKRKLFLGVALPMGLIDFVVPFAPKMGVALFELVIFALSLISLIVAVKITSNVRAQLKDQVTTTSSPQV